MATNEQDLDRLIDDYIDALIENAPHLTPEQRLRLHGLLFGDKEPPAKPYPVRRGSKKWRQMQEEASRDDE